MKAGAAKFRRNPRPQIWILTVWTLLCWPIPAVYIYAMAHPSSQISHGDWTWTKVTLLTLIIYGCWMVGVMSSILTFSTRFTQEIIVQRRWIGSRSIAWDEVTRAVVNYLPTSRGPSRSKLGLCFYDDSSEEPLIIPLDSFVDAYAAIEEVEKHLPPSAVRDFHLVFKK